MNYLVAKYPQGTFSWADVASKDIVATKNFLTGLFGWTYTDMPTGEGRPDYTMFYLNGNDVAGGSPGWEPTMPSYWSSYICVDNLDEICAKVESNGGKIVMPAMDVLDSGRMAGIQDPGGAVVCLWQPKKHIGAIIINTIGAMCWNELYTKDLEKSKQFFSSLFGWTYVTDEAGYVTIQNNGRSNGGMMAITQEMGTFPPNWTVYFTIKNTEESLARVKELGGTVCMPTKNVSVGKITMVQDPAGAALMLIEMSVTPEEWKE